MYSPADLSIWTGRDDSAEAGDVRRLFQIVQSIETNKLPQHAAAILGFSCDAGVSRNKGRVGAQDGPDTIRKVLAGLPAHHHQAIYDCGTISCPDSDLEKAQSELGQHVAKILSKNVSPVILGGGHEIAWGSYQGLKEWLISQEDTRAKSTYSKRKLLILNLDAHFDLRTSRPASSGTPFDQIARDCLSEGRPFKYACWGVSRIANTPALFERAHQLEADILEDIHFQERHLETSLVKLQHLLDDADDVYLTIDIDVLPAGVAPGVSAPASLGVPLSVIEAVAKSVKDSGKMRLVDLAEFNPRFDIDGHTARAIARLVWGLMGTNCPA